MTSHSPLKGKGLQLVCHWKAPTLSPSCVGPMWPHDSNCSMACRVPGIPQCQVSIPFILYLPCLVLYWMLIIPIIAFSSSWSKSFWAYLGPQAMKHLIKGLNRQENSHHCLEWYQVFTACLSPSLVTNSFQFSLLCDNLSHENTRCSLKLMWPLEVQPKAVLLTSGTWGTCHKMGWQQQPRFCRAGICQS